MQTQRNTYLTHGYRRRQTHCTYTRYLVVYRRTATYQSTPGIHIQTSTWYRRRHAHTYRTRSVRTRSMACRPQQRINAYYHDILLHILRRPALHLHGTVQNCVGLTCIALHGSRRLRPHLFPLAFSPHVEFRQHLFALRTQFPLISA